MQATNARGDILMSAQMRDCAYEGHLGRLVQSIRPLFPDGARFNMKPCYNDFCVLIDWELPGAGSGRPKKSRRINLLIERDIIEDIMTRHKPAWLRMAETKLRLFIAGKLRTFNPVHDPAAGIGEEEMWVVTARSFSGPE